MWSINSPFPKNNNKSSYAIKSSFSEKIKDNASNKLFCEIYFKTPIKEIKNLVENNNIPLETNFKYYLGDLYSPEPISKTQINNFFGLPMSSPNKNSLFTNSNKENFLNVQTYKSPYIEKSSYSMKRNSFSYNFNIKNYCLSSTEKQITINDENINDNELTKKNLCLLFNNTKNNDSFDEYEDLLFKNKFIVGEKENFMDSKNIKFCFDSPNKIKKIQKKIFECSGSTFETFSSMSKTKKKRLRKNDKQLFLLKKFYSEHKHWSKIQIKEISSKIGIKENKVYKWLWDQRNKDAKKKMFVVK